MISAAHEDDRPATTVSAPASTAPVAPPVPLAVVNGGGAGVVECAHRFDHLAVELEADAAAVTRVLRLALLGVVGLVLLLAVLL